MTQSGKTLFFLNLINVIFTNLRHDLVKLSKYLFLIMIKSGKSRKPVKIFRQTLLAGWAVSRPNCQKGFFQKKISREDILSKHPLAMSDHEIRPISETKMVKACKA